LVSYFYSLNFSARLFPLNLGDSDRDCTAEDLIELRYLEQCIKEALRIYPPVPFFTRKVRKDFTCCKSKFVVFSCKLSNDLLPNLAGYKIPKGATLLVAPSLVQMDKDVNTF
jgi:hypothetical protein